MSDPSPDTVTVNVWRGGRDGELRAYRVPLRDNQTVLDLVTEVQRNVDPTLSYRFACRVGVCGSCAMTINGRPRWACRTHVSRAIRDGVITIEPLRHLPLIKDLACDMAPFFEKWHRAGGVFRGSATRHQATAAISPEDRRRKSASAAIECINCAACYSACDVVGWNPDYLGPAALNRAWTLVNDQRHADRESLLERVLGDGGCSSCHTQGKCTRSCPVDLSPTRSIAGLKRLSLLGLLGVKP